MDLGIAGKLALVTGSTAGIGLSIARQLAREGATVYVNGRTQSGVTVNSVLPGPTDSEAFGGFFDAMAKQTGTSRKAISDGFFATARPSSLLKRAATTDEVASMVTYLCSEAASATTGSSIRVDGGVVRSVA